MSILEVRDVSIIYSDDKRVAVEHASFKIEAGEYACIIGSNGSGKSTLVKGIVGLVPVTSGEVIHALSPEQYAYLSQITELYDLYREVINVSVLERNQNDIYKSVIIYKADNPNQVLKANPSVGSSSECHCLSLIHI